MSGSKIIDKEKIFLNDTTNQEENSGGNKDFISSVNNSVDPKKEYKPTNLKFVQNMPIMEPNNFQDIINEYKRNNKKNNINYNEKDKIITLKLDIKNLQNTMNKSGNIFDSINNQDSGVNTELLRDGNDIKNNENIKPPNKELQVIEIINLKNNSPEENSFNNNSNSNFNNTIKLVDNDDEDNNYFAYQNINNILDNKLNKNTILDIDNISENNNSDNLEINKNSNEVTSNEMFVTFNKNKQNSNQNESQIPVITKQTGYSPIQISSFDSKKDGFSSYTNKNKDNNILSPMNPEISPLLKILNKSDSNEINIKNNFHNINININNNGNNLINFSKTNFESLNSFIQQKDKEFSGQYGMPPYNNSYIKNMKHYSNKRILENWHRMADFLGQNNINGEINNIINLLLNKKDKNNIFDINNFNPIESSTKIITNIEVKPLYDSNNNISDDDNDINNNESNGNRIINNVKEIPQDNEKEYSYEPTNLSFILNTDIRKILDRNKLNEVIIYLDKKANLQEENKEETNRNEYMQNEKNNLEMEAIAEVEDEYNNDSLKISRKNSLVRSKLSKNEENIRKKNTWGSLDNININNKNDSNNKKSNINLSPKRERNNHLSLSSKNLDISEKYSTPYNSINTTSNKNNINKNNSNEYNNKNEKEIKNVEIPDFTEFFDANNNKETKNIHLHKIINLNGDNNIKFNFNPMKFQQQFKEIDEFFENCVELIEKENKGKEKKESKINLDLNLAKSSSNNMNQKSNYLFNNILTKDNNNNDNDEQKDDLDNLFKRPYQSLNVNIKGGNEKTEFNEHEDEKENNINKNSNDKNIKDDINKFENSINKKEFHWEEKNYNNNKEEEKIMKINDINMNNQNENKTNDLYPTEKFIIDNNNLYNPFSYSNNKDKNTTNNNINSNINNTKNISDNYEINIKINNNESLKEEDSNKLKQEIIIKNKNNENDIFFSDNKNKEIDNNLKMIINNDGEIKGNSNYKNSDNIENTKKEEYDFDIDEEEYNQLVNNDIQNNKNNKNETEESNDLINSKNNQGNNNEIKKVEYENNNTNYENEFKNESSIENQIENNNNNNDIINDKDSNNNSEKLGNDEKIIISNTEDKNDYNKYIQSPFNSPTKLSITEEKNNNIHFENNDNIKNPSSLKILTQSQINKISTKPKQKAISKYYYELLIKKLINLTDYHKKKIIVDESNINNDIISKEKNEALEIKFKNFKSKIKELKDQKIKINDINNIKDLENNANIRQKREEMKNIYKDLIKYINNIYKKDKDKKRKSYQTVIDCLKDYEKLDENEYLNQNNIEILKNVDNDNGDKINDKDFKKLFAIGAILLPLLYLVNFFYSNFK